MMKKKSTSFTIFLLFFLLQAFFLFASLPVTLNEIARGEGCEVEVKGFLYSMPGGRYILTSQPNLKSCCQGSADRLHEQLVIAFQENPKQSHSVVALKGNLIKELQYDSEGKPTQYWKLNDAVFINNSDAPFKPSLIAIGALLTIPVVGWFLIRKKVAV